MTTFDTVLAGGTVVRPHEAGVVDPHAHIGFGGGLDEMLPGTGAALLGGTAACSRRRVRRAPTWDGSSPTS